MTSHKDIMERAWNAALDHANIDGLQLFELQAPSKVFDEWYERNVLNPPEGWEDHHD